MRALIISFAFVVIITSAIGDETAYNKARLKELRGIKIETVASVAVARLSQSNKPTSGGNDSHFHGYEVSTKWKLLGAKEAAGVVAILRDTIDPLIAAYASAGSDSLVELSSLCLPHPGYAVHVVTENGFRDFAICLECGEAYVFAGTHKAIKLHFSDANNAALRACYTAEL